MQDGTFNTCTGIFTDSGGTTGAYGGNEDFTITLCSDIPGLGIELDFTVFNLGPITATPDTMTIYDGPDTASPLIGVYTGFTSPGFVEATGATGCLTIRFQSDIAISGPGWQADISCCQIISASFDGSTPADSGGIIVADPLDVITFNGSGTFSVDGTGATYLWDFGDGMSDTGTTVNHAYATSGVYNVNLTVTDAAGCSSSNNINVQCIIGNGDLDAQMVGPNAFARGSYTEIGLRPSGTFGAPRADTPVGYHDSRETLNNLFGYIANRERDGWVDYDGDYFTPGSPEEGFALEIDGVNYNNNTVGLQEIPGNITSAGIESDPCSGELAVIRWSGVVDNIQIERKIFVTGFGLFIQMETTLTNLDVVPKDNVFWMHNVDPDNNQTINAGAPPDAAYATTFFTRNEIVSQPTVGDPLAFVCATQEPWSAPTQPDATGSNVCLYATDDRARVSYGGFGNRDASDVWNAAAGLEGAVGSVNIADEAISLAMNLGTINPGESVSFTYLYVFLDFDGTGVINPTLIRFSGTDPSLCGATDGTITIQGLVPSTIYDITYDDDGVTVGPAPFPSDAAGNIVITGLDAGVYDRFNLTNALGCNFDGLDRITLTDPGAPVYIVTPTDPTTCVADGTIEISGLNPSTVYDVTYTVDGVVVGPVSYTTDASGIILLIGLDQGTYTGITVDLGTCSSVDAGTYILSYPTLSAFTVTTTDPPTCTADGTLTIGGLNVGEMYDITYTVDGVVVGPVTYTADGAGNIVLTGLDAGTYTDITVFQAGCSIVDAGPYIIAYPPVTFTVASADPSMCDASGSLTLDGLLPSTTYQITYTVDGVVIGPTGYTTDGTGQIIIAGLVAGTYTDITVQVSTCVGIDAGPYVLSNPAVAFAVATADPTMCDDSGSITISGLFPSDTVQVTYTVDGVVVGPVAYTTDGTGAFVITGLAAGTYTDITVVTGSCTVVDPGPYVLSNPAFSFTTASIDPALCDDSGSLTLSGLFASDTVQVTYTVDGVVVGPVAYTTDATGELIIAGLIAGTYTDITVVSGSCTFVDPGPYVLIDIVLDIVVSARDATTCGPTGQLNISNLLAGETYDVSYVVDGVPVAAAPYTADGSGIIIITGLIDGTYTDVTVTLNSCTDVEPGPFVIGLPPNPIVVAPTPYRLCDDGVADGFTEFDLTVKIPEITGGAGDVSVSFHLTLADADTGAAPLPALYTNVTNPQTVYVRVESVTTGCYATTTLELEVLDAPAAVTPTPLEYCDPDNDGFGVFNLEDATVEITGGVAGVVVTYHETLADANNGVLALTSPYNNIVFGTQTVYARVENSGTTGDCFVIVELQLIVLDTPQIVDPEPLTLCDDNDDGIVVFDLTVKNPEILDGLDPGLYTVEYYEDFGYTSLISPDTAYTNLTNPQTVYVLVTDNTNLCTSVTTLELIVNFPPRVFAPAPLELCDVNNPGDEVEEFNLELATPEITGGDTSLIVTYHETAADADAGIGALTSPYTNTVNPQTIYVRVEDPDTGCFVSDVVTLDLRVNPQPSPTTDPTPIEVCDTDNDGFVDSFVLTDRDIEIINGELDVVVSYHETLLDAELDLFALTSPYANIVAYNQVVYARVENTLTGCFTIVELPLVVLDSPVLPLEIDDLVVCDDNDDGIAIFDLTLQEPQIYGTQDPATLILTYHESEADAQSGTDPIDTPTAYVNSTNPQTIWVRLEDPLTGCVTVGSFELVVSLPPVIAMPGDLPAYELCDDETADGFTLFDLTSQDAAITLGAPGLLVQYYTSDTDAQDDTNAIDPATAFTNTVNPQTIWVRVSDADTGCVSFTTITLRVLPNPSPNTDPTPIELCDAVTLGDGIEVFDLTQREAEIIGGEPGVSATYYETRELAEAGDPLEVIPDPTNYSNTTTPQIIYVRITNDTTGCYTIVELPIVVHPLPETPEVPDYIICEVATDGFAIFDLTTKTPEVLGSQDPTNLEVTYHEVEADADAGINAIATPESFPNATNPQTIYVRITNTATGCYSATQSFDLEVREGATATAPLAVYTICDNLGDGTDGIATFTLSTQDAEILGTQDPLVYVVSYYPSEADANADTNQLPDSYTNTENPQTVWARVTNTDTGCFALTTLTLEVVPLPVITLQDSYRLCVDENGNAIQNEDGEESPPVLDTGLSSADFDFVWSVDGTPVGGNTPSIVATQGGTYSVTVTDRSGFGCMATASTTVTVSSPPTTYSAQVITQAFADAHAIQAEASGLGSYLFQLDDGPLQESGLFEGVMPGEHVVTITDINGCGSVSILVGVIDYPLFFTPNQDGYHDTWNIIGIAANPTAKIYIFDRFGKLLKQLSPTGPGWDGTFNGNPMPSSDYWFQVIYDEDDVEKEFRGHFTLKR